MRAVVGGALCGLLSLGACASEANVGEATGPLMRPGEDCLSCHSENSGRNAPPWSLAGTVFPSPDALSTDGVPDVAVRIFDADGQVVATLMTNEAGNFYTDMPLPTGFRVGLEYEGEQIEMSCSPPAGLCNACHSDPPTGGAPGRIFIPQAREADAPGFDCERWMPSGGAANARRPERVGTSAAGELRVAIPAPVQVQAYSFHAAGHSSESDQALHPTDQSP